MAKKRFKRLGKRASAGLTALCLVAAGVFALLLTPVFDVRTVTVRGNKTVSQEEIIRGSGIIEGTNIFNISLRRVSDNLESMNRISSVKVKRILPSTISITVEEGAPAAYVLVGGDCVGITSDGRVVTVTNAPAELAELAAAEALNEKTSPDGSEAAEDENGESESGESGENEEANEEIDEDAEAEIEAESEPKRTSSGVRPFVSATGLDRAVVTGMGAAQYRVGRTIVFDDEVKGEQLLKLLDEFLCDDICLGVSRVDMSRYDNVSMDYGEGLRIKLGAAEELDFKLKSFKAIMNGQLGEDAKGTLDLSLDRPTYSPRLK